MNKYLMESTIEEMDEILDRISSKKNKTTHMPNLGPGIYVEYSNIEGTIERMDMVLTNLVHGGICDGCEESYEESYEESCDECNFYHKKKEFHRVYKIIKGDWSPNRKE